MTLSNRALLVQLSISQWTARKYDRGATAQVAASYNTTMDAGRYNKSLLPMNDQLKAIHQKSAVIRRKFYENTLPWGIEGTMILPTDNYMDFMSDFKNEKHEWQALVDVFVEDYPLMRQGAASLLGNLYNPDDYPADADIANRFKMDLALFPVPTTDFRVDLGQDHVDAIRRDVEARVMSAQTEAMQALWKRLYERVSHIAEKLQDPKGVFRDSMVENALKLCDLLPKLNVDGNPELDRLGQALADSLNHPVDDIRHDTLIRNAAADKARDIMNQMGAFMGQ